MAERENVVDFTVPYYDLVGITILMKKPKAATSLFKFLTVLENDVWLCILAAYFFTRFVFMTEVCNCNAWSCVQHNLHITLQATRTFPADDK